MAEDDIRYYQRRAHEEAAAADTESQPAIASAHRLLAIEYAAEAEALARDRETEAA